MKLRSFINCFIHRWFLNFFETRNLRNWSHFTDGLWWNHLYIDLRVFNTINCLLNSLVGQEWRELRILCQVGGLSPCCCLKCTTAVSLQSPLRLDCLRLSAVRTQYHSSRFCDGPPGPPKAETQSSKNTGIHFMSIDNNFILKFNYKTISWFLAWPIIPRY